MDKDFRFTLYNNICEIESDKDNQLVIRFLNKYVTGYEELKEFQGGYSKKVKNPVALYLTVEEDSKVKYLFPRGLWDLIEDKDKLAIKSKFKIEDKSTDEFQLDELTINNFRDKLKSILQPESGFDLREDQVTAIFKALKVKRGLIQYPTGCLVGKSKIIMTNDIIKSISEMEKNKEKYIGKRVYSVTKEGHPEFGEIEDIFISRTVDELIKIEFFGVDCKPILCTDNHPFLVGNDIYKEAGKLRKRDLVYSMSFEDIQGIIIRDNSVRVIRRELLKIKSIKRIKLDSPTEVYDMTIKGYNNFTVMVDDNRGAVVHNSGKTEIMSGIIKSLVTKYPEIRLLVLEPTDILVNNTARRFQKYGIDALPYKSTRRQINNNVIVSHPIGLLNDLEKEPELLKCINGVFWDEAHHIKSNTWSFLNVCIPNAEYTLGFSALTITKEHRYETNLKKLDIDEVLALGAVSRLLCETTPRYYINKGILACPVVIQFKAWIVKTAMTNNNWQVLRKAILESYERINIGLKAINILVKYNRRCLILVDTKVQAYKIMNQLADKFNLSDKAGLAFGGNIGLRLDKKKYESRRINPEEIESISNQKKKTEIRKRQLEITESCLFNVENITDRFDKNEFNILVATTVADEGLDLDSLDSVLLISAGRKDRRFIQRVGRTIRKSKTGKFGYVLDLNDSGNNILEFHSKERMRIYRDVIEAYDECIYENFDVEQFEYLFKKLEGIEKE